MSHLFVLRSVGIQPIKFVQRIVYFVMPVLDVIDVGINHVISGSDWRLIVDNLGFVDKLEAWTYHTSSELFVNSKYVRFVLVVKSYAIGQVIFVPQRENVCKRGLFAIVGAIHLRFGYCKGRVC